MLQILSRHAARRTSMREPRSYHHSCTGIIHGEGRLDESMHGRHHAASVPGCSSSTHISMFATPCEGIVGSCAKLQRIYSPKPAGLPGIHQRRVLIGGSVGCICVALCLVHATGPQRSYLGSETASRSLLHACMHCGPWLPVVLVIG